MSWQGQWEGQWQGKWDGPVEANLNAISGTANGTSSVSGTLTAVTTASPSLPDYKQGGWHGEYYDHSKDIWAYEKTVKKQQSVIKGQITRLKKKIKLYEDGAETAAEARQRVEIEQRISELQQQQENLLQAFAEALRIYQDQQWLNEQIAQEQLAREILIAQQLAEQEAIRQEVLRQEELRRIEEEDIVYVMTMLASM